MQTNDPTPDTDRPSFVAVVQYDENGTLQILKRYDDATVADYDAYLSSIESVQNNLPRMLTADRALSSLAGLVREAILDLNLMGENGQLNTEKMEYALKAVAMMYSDALKSYVEKLFETAPDDSKKWSSPLKSMGNSVLISSANSVIDYFIEKTHKELIKQRGHAAYKEDQHIFLNNQAKYEAMIAASQSQIADWLASLKKEYLSSSPQKALA